VVGDLVLISEGSPDARDLVNTLPLRGSSLMILVDLLAANETAFFDTLCVVAALAAEAGARVSIGGSPWLKGEGVAAHWAATGLDLLAASRGWELVDLERLPFIRVCAGRRVYHLPRILLERDLIFNLSAAYRHRRLQLAGAMFGLLNALPGTKQATILRLRETGATLDDIIVDLTALVTPVLHGLRIHPDNCGGTASSDPSVWLWSKDPLMLDSTAAHLVGLGAERLAWLNQAAESGLGLIPLNSECHELCGRAYSLMSLPLFDADRLTAWPAPIEDWAGFAALPQIRIDSSKCLRCDACLEACPVHSSSHASGRKLLRSHSFCVQCRRCISVCPAGALQLQPGRLGLRDRFVGRKSCDD